MINNNRVRPVTKGMLLAMVLAGGIFVSPAGAQFATPAPGGQPPAAAAQYRSQLNWLPRRAKVYYQAAWGVDSLRLKWAESGEIIRFSYRVLDPDRAAALNDKKAEPALIDPQAGVSLVVPSVANIGKLRQSSTPQAGMSYWMAFSNKGRLVKRGDRVNVVIGHFKAEGLVVE
jgi:hypothetical protein